MWKTILIAAIILTTVIFMFNIFRKKSTETTMDLDISVEEFKQKRAENRGVIIDVRTKAEYEEGHLVEVDHQYDLMNGDFSVQLDNLSKDETYYLYCRTGNRSGKAARMMKQNGFEEVYNIGGFEDLANAGFETE